jgi:hypothetical protein
VEGVFRGQGAHKEGLSERKKTQEVDGVGEVDQITKLIVMKEGEGFRGAQIKEIDHGRNHGFREWGEIHLQKFRISGVDDATVDSFSENFEI